MPALNVWGPALRDQGRAPGAVLAIACHRTARDAALCYAARHFDRRRCILVVRLLGDLWCKAELYIAVRPIDPCSAHRLQPRDACEQTD
jgi:hypothetical protein